MDKPFFILSLDGGGSLGVYTLGVLVEIERMLGEPLHTKFDLVYGTSTGAIIGSMIALGNDVESTIKDFYLSLTPDVMSRFWSRSKTAKLTAYAEKIYGDKTFEDFGMNIGIVATHLEYNRPTIFKRTMDQAHGSQGSFKPGFGVKISDAIIASCAAYPVFRQKVLITPNHGTRTIIDGGFTANNPILFALTDALGPLNIRRKNIRILSIGTGNYPEQWRFTWKLFNVIPTSRIILKLLKTSSNTVETLRKLLFADVMTVRIDDTNNDYKTDFIESNRNKLDTIFQLGRKSFERAEPEVRRLFSHEKYE